MDFIGWWEALNWQWACVAVLAVLLLLACAAVLVVCAIEDWYSGDDYIERKDLDPAARTRMFSVGRDVKDRWL